MHRSSRASSTPASSSHQCPTCYLFKRTFNSFAKTKDMAAESQRLGPPGDHPADSTLDTGTTRWQQETIRAQPHCRLATCRSDHMASMRVSSDTAVAFPKHIRFATHSSALNSQRQHAFSGGYSDNGLPCYLAPASLCTQNMVSGTYNRRSKPSHCARLFA